MEANLGNAIDYIVSVPILRGVGTKNIELTATTPLKVYHHLKRTPIGWFMSDTNAYANVKRNAWDKSTITLESDADCTISIWCF